MRPEVERLLKAANAQPGDKVRVTTADGASYEGLLMPSHAFSQPDIVTLKLGTGYNVGLRLDAKAHLQKLADASPRTPVVKKTPEPSPGKPTVAVLGTGGTIASFVEYRTGAVYPAKSADELIASVPELSDFANVKAKVVYEVFSEDLVPDNWRHLAREVAAALNGGAMGVVIPHGTDTLGFTAAALSFMLRDLTGPVVLVGAQRSSDRPSSDAALNLLASARLAAFGDLGEVVVCMHGESSDTRMAIHRGAKVRKLHSSRRDAFRSVNVAPLGHVEKDQIVLDQPHRPRAKGPVQVDDRLEENVGLLYTYPGMGPDDLARERKRKGLVLAGTGLGHASRRMLPALRELTQGGTTVVMTTQCLWGRVNMNVYSTGRDQLQAGVLSGEDLLPETAYVKLMHVLGHAKSRDDVVRLWNANEVGESSEETRFE